METEEALKTIPLLSRKDLKREIEDDSLIEEDLNGIRHFHYEVNTMGITYLNIFFTLYGLKEEDIPYANLLTSILCSMNTDKHSYVELSRLSNAYTGGLGFNVSAYSRYDNSADYTLFCHPGKSSDIECRQADGTHW